MKDVTQAMKYETYIARTNRDKDGNLPKGQGFREQLLKDHLEGVAKFAGGFASKFGMKEMGHFLGLSHDIGKYSLDFQERVRGSNKRVDHTTAGGREVLRLMGVPLLANIIFGHHGGLLNYGDGSDREGTNKRAVSVRMKEEYRIPGYCYFKNEVELQSPMEPFKKSLAGLTSLPESYYSLAFLTRMLFSCLVDADFLNTEFFIKNQTSVRGNHDSIGVLLDKLNEYFKINGFHQPIGKVNSIRKGILDNCIIKADSDRGLFSLTVPTGGGKTLSSMAFALNHAKRNEMQRVIYVIPYTSIIEQNADVFKKVFGQANVLENHCNVTYDNKEDDLNKRSYLAAENWDVPIVVTTNVQFFESLYAHKTSKTRKIHNIVNSVIIFDEAQMLPVGHLKPCVYAINELVQNYHCTAVLCTATQPSLNIVWPKGMEIVEICENHLELYSDLKRTSYAEVGHITDEELVECLAQYDQVLCVVNTKKHAQNLYDRLSGNKFHLSTQMCPAHRKEILKRVRCDLEEGQHIALISTSLIEAGVDLDFQTVFRAKAGLDSIIQAGGRCNREGEREIADSYVYVFDCDQEKYNTPLSMEQNIVATNQVLRYNEAMDTPDAIKAYFDSLYKSKGDDFLDIKNIIKKHDEMELQFEDISKNFKLIEEDTKQIVIPYDDEARRLIKLLQYGEISRSLMRKLSPYLVRVRCYQHRDLEKGKHIKVFQDKDLSVLISVDIYTPETGLKINLEQEEGKAIILDC